MFLQLLGFAIQGIQGTANTNIWPVLISSPNSELGPLGNGKTKNYVQQIQHKISVAADKFILYTFYKHIKLVQ